MSTPTMTSSPAELGPRGFKLKGSAQIGAYFGYFSTLAWFVVGVDSILRPYQDNRRDAAWFVCFIPFMLMFWSLGKIHEPLRNRFERVMFWALMLASGLAMAGQIGNVFEIERLKALGFPLGALIWMAGMIVYGIAAWRLHVVPWYSCLSLILWEPGSIATGLALAPISPLRDRGSYSAGIEKALGTLLIAIGLHLYSRKRN